MEPNDSNDPERKSSPGMAKLITVALVAMAAYSVASTKHLDSTMGMCLVALVLFWSGYRIDRFFGGR